MTSSRLVLLSLCLASMMMDSSAGRRVIALIRFVVMVISRPAALARTYFAGTLRSCPIVMALSCQVVVALSFVVVMTLSLLVVVAPSSLVVVAPSSPLVMTLGCRTMVVALSSVVVMTLGCLAVTALGGLAPVSRILALLGNS